MSTETETKVRELVGGMVGQTSRRYLPVSGPGDESDERVFPIAFSSEEPVFMGRYYEVLDHSPGSIRTQRIEQGIAVLVDHDTKDLVGITQGFSIGDDRMCRTETRFGESARAKEIQRDVETGIRKWVSFAYAVHAAEDTGEVIDDLPVLRTTDWEPLEVSYVAIPADPHVGYNRTIHEAEDRPEEEIQEEVMSDNNTEVQVAATAAPAVDVSAERADAQRAERDRVRQITDIGRRHEMRELAEEFVNKGAAVDEFRAAVLDKMGTAHPISETSADLGLTEKEVQRYSLSRAIIAQATPGDARLQKAAGFEIECSRAAADILPSDRRGNLAIPNEISRRDMVVGTDADGGYLKGTDHRGDAFIDVLRNKMMVKAMGAQDLPGLVGDQVIPSMTAPHTAYWLSAESTAATESKATLGQVSLSPKTVGALSDISRKLLLQSNPAIDSLVLRDLAAVLGVAIDAAALHGSGSSGQPTGIASTSGIGSVAGGTNGLAPALSHIVGLETEVAVDNADIGALGYLTNAKVRGKLKQTFPNTTGGDLPIWRNGMDGFGEMNGYRVGCTNQVSSTLTKGTSSGVCSAIFFGNWADLLIGMWGGLDLLVDPYTSSSNGWLRITAFQSVDIAVRRAQSFAAMLDALTS